MTGVLLAALLQVPPADAEFFERRIRPVLVEHCYPCHSAAAGKTKGDLRLDTRDGLRKGGSLGPAVVPGDPDAGLLLRAVRHADPELKMPPKKRLPEAVVADLADWVRRGAPDPRGTEPPPSMRPLWSLQPLRDAAPPPGESPHPVDRFIRASLAARGLAPSPRAGRRTLLRRASFDLTGLPPSPEELDAFERDTAPGAWERVVDRLLESPRYGERWGRHWLDAVHYADTHGYDKDKVRPHAWPYRDYVIRAFNEDLPYSRFVQEQLAGDVLFPDDPRGIVATGLIAAGPWDFVGHVELPETKTDGLVARYNDRDDMVMTTASTFLSLTVHCARCHDHKFDPVTQEDYYALQAVFAGIDRADRPFEPDPAVHRRRRELEARRRAIAPVPALEALDRRLDESRRRPASSPTNGYHSGIESDPGTAKWVEVDLGRTVAADEIRLVPARPTDFRDTPGFGFPVRYRVEADGEVLLDRTLQDAPSPGDAAVIVPAGRPLRRVRVTALRLAERANDFIFALAELQVMSGSVNAAAGAAVTSLDSIEAGRWSRSFLVDGFSSRAPIGEDPVRALERERAALVASLPPAERARVEELAAIGRELAALPAPSRVYAAANDFAPAGGFVPARAPRVVHVLSRGDVKRPLKPAVPGGVASVRSAPFGDASGGEGARRAALARWLTDPANVLLRRSIVNRVWALHFGRGLVETLNDFGRMGGEPSHPELLDWLARWFQENGESLKALHRLLLTSETWQQSSSPDPLRSRIDAENRLLWRANASRLDVESFRDALLSVSGRLDLREGGPGDRAFRFKDDHSPVYDYAAADPEASRRRGVYRFIVRSVPDPFYEALDGADPSILTPRRGVTLTALQALAAWNDAFVLRQCEHLAARAGSIEEAVRLAWGRVPGASEAARLAPYAARHGLAAACRLLVNANEFMFVE